MEITSFIFTSVANVLWLKRNLGMLKVIARGYWKLPNFLILLNEKSLSLSSNLAHARLCELLIVFLTKVNLLFFLNLMVFGFCLMYLIRQSCILESFIRTLILMTSMSLYQLSLQELIRNYNMKLLVTPRLIKKVITDHDQGCLVLFVFL